MSEDKQQQENNAHAGRQNQEVEVNEVEESTVENSQDIDGFAKEKEQYEQEIAELKNKLVRSVAEVENTRKRFQQQLQDNSKFAASNFAKSMLDVFEDLYRLSDNAPQVEEGDAELKAFISGINLTKQNLEKALQTNGIERIYPLEQKFDHNLHQAISQIESDAEAGTVLQVISAGYCLNGRILKEALVAISKGR